MSLGLIGEFPPVRVPSYGRSSSSSKSDSTFGHRLNETLSRSTRPVRGYHLSLEIMD